jgi:hypothetical protein
MRQRPSWPQQPDVDRAFNSETATTVSTAPDRHDGLNSTQPNPDPTGVALGVGVDTPYRRCPTRRCGRHDGHDKLPKSAPRPWDSLTYGSALRCASRPVTTAPIRCAPLTVVTGLRPRTGGTR